MSITELPDGRWEIAQSLAQPIVYMDHWAVRLFSMDDALQSRFVQALKAKNGALLFSQNNLSEFCAMKDAEQAVKAERFINGVLPNFYIADFTQAPFKSPKSPAEGPGAPPQNWLLYYMGMKSPSGGAFLSVENLISTLVQQSDRLRPDLEEMKKRVAEGIGSFLATDSKEAKRFVPRDHMATVDILFAEFTRDFHLNPAAKFTENDTIDLVHAAYAAPIADFLLLDARWCDKVVKARQRMAGFGMKRHLARVYSKKPAHG
ncbi:hypothetical protein [Hydrogenophaga sp.]|uniref:hypothetical protein n=1 Tax=Hydrogenophaga sp. TaxID=1904254 RepID=UPI00262A1DE9|nr:hypothetical protein [Hydrogenophaga sp.]MCW5653577.1 hypothetical protein [Hydrogenophaga sp.]